MSEDKTLTKIPHFDGHYNHWRELMENLLRAKGLWSVVKIGFSEPEEGTMLAEAQKCLEKVMLYCRIAKIDGNQKVKKSILNASRREFEILKVSKIIFQE